jgi:hypothetical protein
MWLLKVPDDFPEGENNEADFAFKLRDFCADLDLQPSSSLGSKRKWQKLSFGAAMPLGELQEDMHVGEGLPIGRIDARLQGNADLDRVRSWLEREAFPPR